MHAPRMWMLFSCLLALAMSASWAATLRIDPGRAWRDGQPCTVRRIGALAAGGRQTFALQLAARETLALRVPFAAAPFNGTQLNARINGRRLVPYFAFGGDTRYDAVRGKPGMRPPVGTIEGRWVIPAGWLRSGDNDLRLWTTGIQRDATLERLGPKPEIRIDGIILVRLNGTDLPVYANSVYYDFSVWSQGYAWGNDPNRLNYDLALLGVINGKGMPDIIPPLGGPESAIWGTKRACEDNALGWGMGHQEFYTIWEFAQKPQAWADFLDVDKNPETGGGLHEQTVFSNLVPKGADAVLFNPDKYAATLEPAIRLLAPYTDFYDLKCEQDGPRGAGFDADGERWKDYGLHGDDWARNYYAANKAAHDLVRNYDPDDGRIEEMNHWRYGMRPVLYDTARRRKQPMGDLVDILMLHFDLMEENDRGPDGRSNDGNAFERQYPCPGFTHPPTGEWPAGNRFPEIALDFNRYRLSRTEADMTLGDPKVHRWGNGQPFDFRAGFRGDEMMYNSENGIWNTGYSASSPYQFLHGFFSYSLLPTGAGEPRDMSITVRRSIAETRELPVRKYGDWVEGAGHTKRLRTVDPLYGDMFGWTGTEHCNFGDYITMVGIKEPHHRLPSADAFSLVRRTCYAFLTTGPVVPLMTNPGHSDQLFVKSLVQTFNSQRYIGIYAANMGNAPEQLDVTLPIAAPAGATALLFDDRAWDWTASARLLPVPPGNAFRYRAQVPALGAWLVLIPATPAMIAAMLGVPAPPAPVSPAPDAALEAGQPELRWQPGETPAKRYRVEIAREALFRPQDRVELAEAPGAAYTVKSVLPASGRYFWRVSAVDARGRHGLWSAPQAFVYRWPEYARAFPAGGAPVAPVPAPPPIGPPNLAWQGEIWGTGGYMCSPSRAVDGQEFSFWTNGQDEGNSVFGLPADWCVIWRTPTTVHSVKIHWLEEALPAEFILQGSDDGKAWREIHRWADPAVPITTVTLDPPRTMRYLRIVMPRACQPNGMIGIREVTVE